MDDAKYAVAEEFQILFQPLSLEDRTELEEKLVTEGLPQTVCVWQKTKMEPPEKY